MKRVRWLIVMLPVLLLLAVPLGKANADSRDMFAIDAPQAGTYSVYYRSDSEDPWKKYGVYRTSEEAYSAAWKLESDFGYETYVKYKAP